MEMLIRCLISMLQGLQTSQMELNSVFQHIGHSNLSSQRGEKVKYGTLGTIWDKTADVELLSLPLLPHYFDYPVFLFGLMFTIYLTYRWCSELSECNKNVNLSPGCNTEEYQKISSPCFKKMSAHITKNKYIMSLGVQRISQSLGDYWMGGWVEGAESKNQLDRLELISW